MVTACSIRDYNGDDVCTGEYAYGLTLYISNTNAQIISNVECILRDTEDTNYSEELVFFQDAFIGAGERPGSYKLEIITTNFYISTNITTNTNAAVSTNITTNFHSYFTNFTLGFDGCHVIPETISFTLTNY